MPPVGVSFSVLKLDPKLKELPCRRGIWFGKEKFGVLEYRDMGGGGSAARSGQSVISMTVVTGLKLAYDIISDALVGPARKITSALGANKEALALRSC